LLNSKYHPPGCPSGFFTFQSPAFRTCFWSSQSAHFTIRASFRGTPASPSANRAYAVSHTGETQGCIRNVSPSSIPSFSNSSIARITCGSSTEYPRHRIAITEFMIDGKIAAKPSLISKRSSIHFSARFSASERKGRICTRSAQWVNRSSTRKKFLHEIRFLSQCRCIRDLSRPPTKSSSIPISSGSFLKGFFA